MQPLYYSWLLAIHYTALIDSIKYPNKQGAHPLGKLVIETRIDIVDLANLAFYLNEHGSLPRTRSEVIRLSVGVFIDLVLPNKKVNTVTDSIRLLERLGVDYLGRGSREDKNRATLVGHLQLESLIGEGFDIKELIKDKAMKDDIDVLPAEVAAEALKRFEEGQEKENTQHLPNEK